MKKNKRLFSLILAIFMLLTAPAYTYVPVEATTIAAINTNTKNSVTLTQSRKTTIKLNRTSLVLTKGQKYQLKLSGTTRKAKWYSSNKSIATVSKTGKVTAKKAGTTFITAKINGVSYKCKLTVKAKTQNTVWLSATGNKYHKIPNCGRMNPNRARKVNLSYAKAHRYTPCSKCF